MRPDKWWVERAIMSRALIYKKNMRQLIKLQATSLDKGSEFAEAEWMSGWIALSFLNDPILAIDHFNNFYQNVSYPISLLEALIGLVDLMKKLVIKTIRRLVSRSNKIFNNLLWSISFFKN